MDKNENPDGRSVERRSYLKLAGVAIASVGGSLAASRAGRTADTQTTEVRTEKRYGFGGSPLAQTTAVLAETEFSASENEPNDTRENATPVDTGVDVSGTLDPDEVDWFAFNLSEGTTATIELSKEDSTGVVALAFYDVQGSFVDQLYLSNSSPVSLSGTAPESGTYFAQVVDMEDGSTAYTLRVDSSATDDTVVDYGAQGYGEDGYGGVAG